VSTPLPYFLPSDLSRVVLRSAPSDMLTHESEAYSVLSIGSLEGGGKVFLYQPRYRDVKIGGYALVYYPRLIFIGYRAMSAVKAVWLADGGRLWEEHPSPLPSGPSICCRAC